MAEFCINCEAKSKQLSYNIPIGKNSTKTISLPSALTAVFKNTVNYTLSEENDVKHVLLLCSDCVPIFANLYHSKNSFLGLTSRRSLIGNIVSTTSSKSIKVETQDDDNFNGTKKRAEKSRLFDIIKIAADPLDSKGESIFPDCGNDYGEPIDTESGPTGFGKKVIDFREIFPQIKISKMPTDLKLISKSSSLLLLKCDINEDNVSKAVSSCKNCNRQFSSTELLQEHYNFAHVPFKSEFTCHFCPAKFHLEFFYKLHVKNLHGGVEIQYSCNLCRNVYLAKEKLQEHKLKDHDIRKDPFNCNCCKESFRLIRDLRDHLIVEHPGTVEADAAVSNKKGLEKGESMGLERKCLICDKKWINNVYSLEKHMNLAHGKVELACFACEEKFKTTINLFRHEKSHKHCTECNVSFENKEKLLRHKRRIHDSTGPYAFKCEICGVTYGQKKTMERHYHWHSNIGSPFHACNFCSKSYPLAVQLKQHVKNCHTKERQKIICEEDGCSAKFHHKCELNEHLEKVHKRESTFACKVCDTKFMWKDSLTRHKWSHNKVTFENSKIVNSNKGKKSGSYIVKVEPQNKTRIESTSCFDQETYLYTCPLCKKTQDYKSHFIRHLRTHNIQGYTDIKAEQKLPENLKCSVRECVKYFRRKDQVAKHVRVYHTETSKEYTPRYFKCVICNAEMDTMKMNPHRERHDVKILAENENPVLTKTKAKVLVKKKHKDLNSYYDDDTKEFSCPSCDLYCPLEKQPDFLEHLRAVHKFQILISSQNAKTKNACSECDRFFDCKSKLEKHFLQSHCIKNYDKHDDRKKNAAKKLLKSKT